jgi:hypothetical protein
MILIMGDAPCKVIIIEGSIAYSVVEAIADKFHQVNTLFLESAIRASCEGVHQASLYSAIKNYGFPKESTLQKIIDLHGKITNELPLVIKSEAQEFVDVLTDALFAATRELYLDDFVGFKPPSLSFVRESLKL